jgi:hypothetical protein
MTPEPTHVLRLLPERMALVRLEADAVVPTWLAGPVVSVTRTPEELSILCVEDCVPPGHRVEPGWRCLQVRGPLSFELTGVLAALAGPLAAAGVSIFAMSTFDTDLVLVRDEELDRATAALATAGHRVEQ